MTESGGPTWDSLASALNKIDENFTAEKIKEFSEEVEFALHNIYIFNFYNRRVIYSCLSNVTTTH